MPIKHIKYTAHIKANKLVKYIVIVMKYWIIYERNAKALHEEVDDKTALCVCVFLSLCV